MFRRGAGLLGVIATGVLGCSQAGPPGPKEGNPVEELDMLVSLAHSKADGVYRLDYQFEGLIERNEARTAEIGSKPRFVSWGFTGREGDAVTFQAKGADGHDLDTVLAIYRRGEGGLPVGEHLAFNDDDPLHDVSEGPYLGSRASHVLDGDTMEFVAVVFLYDPESIGEVELRMNIDERANGSECGAGMGECSTNEYCAFEPAAICGTVSTGVCRAKPENASDETAAVCGCDSKNYANSIEAARAGVSVLHEGECKEDNDLSFVCENNDFCAADEFCAFAPRTECGSQGLGVCTARPSVASVEPAEVCGCDGQTYRNAVTAQVNGQTVAHDGACLDSN